MSTGLTGDDVYLLGSSARKAVAVPKVTKLGGQVVQDTSEASLVVVLDGVKKAKVGEVRKRCSLPFVRAAILDEEPDGVLDKEKFTSRAGLETKGENGEEKKEKEKRQRPLAPKKQEEVEKEEKEEKEDQAQNKRTKSDGYGFLSSIRGFEDVRGRLGNTADKFPGFFYQMQMSVLLWTTLDDSERMAIEVGEDIAIQSVKSEGVSFEFSQLKSSFKKRNEKYSICHDKVIGAFRNAIQNLKANPGKTIVSSILASPNETKPKGWVRDEFPSQCLKHLNQQGDSVRMKDFTVFMVDHMGLDDETLEWLKRDRGSNLQRVFRGVQVFFSSKHPRLAAILPDGGK
jgi:hypothetical protein